MQALRLLVQLVSQPFPLVILFLPVYLDTASLCCSVSRLFSTGLPKGTLFGKSPKLFIYIVFVF